MKTIVLDTNFIISSLKYKINLDLEITRIIDSKYQLKIIDKTIDELNKINNKYSKLAITLIKKQEIRKIKATGRDVDSSLVNSSNENTIVATLDKELKQILKKKKIPRMIIRQKKYFKIEY